MQLFHFSHGLIKQENTSTHALTRAYTVRLLVVNEINKLKKEVIVGTNCQTDFGKL